MCNYKYKKKRSRLENTPCIYPDLYVKYPDKFPQTNQLLIDSEGYCLFHSKDISWKNINKFTEKFKELLNSLTEIHEISKNGELNCNFSGFYFCAEINPLILDNYLLESHLDFSYCEFVVDFRLTNSKFSSIDLEGSHFYGTLEMTNVDFNNNVDCPNSTFENGVIISNCQLNGYNYFNNSIFRSINNDPNCVFRLRDCHNVNYINFKESSFEVRVSFDRVIFSSEVIFDKSIFTNEFYFHYNQISTVISFKESEFLLLANLNPLYSSVSFSKVRITKDGRLIFEGKKPFDDMVKGELQMEFEQEVEGVVSFENFNLNKIRPLDKTKLLELEKNGKAVIGKGCRKYYCQTEIFTIRVNDDNQNLVLEIINVFCNYFKIKESYNIGIEIVNRTENEINYFYFTDEAIQLDEFLQRIGNNEANIWQTLSNLTEIASEALSSDNVKLLDCFIQLDGWWKMLGIRVAKNKIKQMDLKEIVNSIAISKKSEKEVVYLFRQINEQFLLAIEQKQIILNLPNMSKIDFHAPVTTVTINDYSQQILQISKENNLSKNDEEKLIQIIENVKKEPQEKKASKLKELMQEWLPTIAATISEAIKPFVGL